jgi:hypothetical protein
VHSDDDLALSFTVPHGPLGREAQVVRSSFEFKGSRQASDKNMGQQL